MQLLDRRQFCWTACLSTLGISLAGCAVPRMAPNVAGLPDVQRDPAAQLAWLNRLTWGANAHDQAELARMGLAPWLQQQLAPPTPAAPLPTAVQAQIDAMEISRYSAVELSERAEVQRKAIDAQPDDAQKQAARQTYQQTLSQLGRETQQRFLWRALYSPYQVQEQMTWFWMNHFNINVRRNNLLTMVGDYAEQAIRPHALGRFRTLLGATVRHPAMLRYLDNTQNAHRRINENYARELMELHTLGVDAGYSQADVQALARVLTGVGVAQRADGGPPPNLRPALAGDYVREGMFEFKPQRHDDEPKTLLGQPLTRRGMGEVDEALDRLARAPATARFIARKLAVYWVADDPPQALVERVAARFQSSNGDIAATLATLFGAPEFAASLGQQFRDPLHYVLAGVRLAYDGQTVTNVSPMLTWLNRMGQPLFARPTPDGYPLARASWSSSGQMTTRFEIARILGASGGVLLRADERAPLPVPAFPPLAASPTVVAMKSTLSEPTRQALADARSPQDWNTYLLASPEFMRR